VIFEQGPAASLTYMRHSFYLVSCACSACNLQPDHSSNSARSIYPASVTDAHRQSIMSSDLSDLYARCHDSFETLLATLSSPVSGFEGQVSKDEVLAEFDRFQLWARSVGAKYSGTKYKFSLDYRLRKAPFYHDRVSCLSPCENTLVNV
jgi:hypothetical protein